MLDKDLQKAQPSKFDRSLITIKRNSRQELRISSSNQNNNNDNAQIDQVDQNDEPAIKTRHGTYKKTLRTTPNKSLISTQDPSGNTKKQTRISSENPFKPTKKRNQKQVAKTNDGSQTKRKAKRESNFVQTNLYPSQQSGQISVNTNGSIKKKDLKSKKANQETSNEDEHDHRNQTSLQEEEYQDRIIEGKREFNKQLRKQIKAQKELLGNTDPIYKDHATKINNKQSGVFKVIKQQVPVIIVIEKKKLCMEELKNETQITTQLEEKPTIKVSLVNKLEKGIFKNGFLFKNQQKRNLFQNQTKNMKQQQYQNGRPLAEGIDEFFQTPLAPKDPNNIVPMNTLIHSMGKNGSLDFFADQNSQDPIQKMNQLNPEAQPNNVIQEVKEKQEKDVASSKIPIQKQPQTTPITPTKAVPGNCTDSFFNKLKNIETTKKQISLSQNQLQQNPCAQQTDNQDQQNNISNQTQEDLCDIQKIQQLLIDTNLFSVVPESLKDFNLQEKFPTLQYAQKFECVNYTTQLFSRTFFISIKNSQSMIVVAGDTESKTVSNVNRLDNLPKAKPPRKSNKSKQTKQQKSQLKSPLKQPSTVSSTRSSKPQTPVSPKSQKSAKSSEKESPPREPEPKSNWQQRLKFKFNLTETKTALLHNEAGKFQKKDSDTICTLKYLNDNQRQQEIAVTQREWDKLKPHEYLNDTLVLFWLKFYQHYCYPHIRNNINLNSSDTKIIPPSSSSASGNGKIYIFDPQFYTKIQESGYSAVKRWTKKVDIFAMEYLFVPICQEDHWSVCCIVRPGLLAEQLQAKLDQKLKKQEQPTKKPDVKTADTLNNAFDLENEKIVQEVITTDKPQRLECMEIDSIQEDNVPRQELNGGGRTKEIPPKNNNIGGKPRIPMSLDEMPDSSQDVNMDNSDELNDSSRSSLTHSSKISEMHSEEEQISGSDHEQQNDREIKKNQLNQREEDNNNHIIQSLQKLNEMKSNDDQPNLKESKNKFQHDNHKDKVYKTNQSAYYNRPQQGGQLYNCGDSQENRSDRDVSMDEDVYGSDYGKEDDEYGNSDYDDEEDDHNNPFSYARNKADQSDYYNEDIDDDNYGQETAGMYKQSSNFNRNFRNLPQNYSYLNQAHKQPYYQSTNSYFPLYQSYQKPATPPPYMPPKASSTQTVILSFDSMLPLNLERMATLRSYLLSEFLDKKASTDQKSKLPSSLSNLDVPSYQPTTPKQYNGTDCGLFLLENVECFLNKPELVLNDLHQKESWMFKTRLVDEKREHMKRVIVAMRKQEEESKKNSDGDNGRMMEMAQRYNKFRQKWENTLTHVKSTNSNKNKNIQADTKEKIKQQDEQELEQIDQEQDNSKSNADDLSGSDNQKQHMQMTD